jgi:hypothetical protein
MGPLGDRMSSTRLGISERVDRGERPRLPGNLRRERRGFVDRSQTDTRVVHLELRLDQSALRRRGGDAIT